MEKKNASLFREINYLFDVKLKLKFIGMMLIILLGSLAELLGVSVIYPIIDLATNPAGLQDNLYCNILSGITGITEPTQLLIALIVSVIVIYVLKNIYMAFVQYSINSFSKNTRKYFSTKLMKAYMKQPYSYFLNKNTAEIMRSVNTDTSNLYTVLSNLLNLVSYLVTTVLLVCYLAVTNLQMTLMVAGILLLCLLIIVLGIQKKVRVLGLKNQEMQEDILKNSKQAFEGIKEVKISNKENYFIEKYQRTYHATTSLELVYNLLNSLPKYLIEAVCMSGIMLYLLVIVLNGGDMAAMVTQLAVFAVAAFRMLPNMNQFYGVLTSLLYNKASIDLIYRDIREVAQISDSEIDKEDIEKVSFNDVVEVQDITFAYDSIDRNVLENVSLRIEHGQSVAFVGESGGGKTTLIDIIIGILNPKSGKVLVDGRDIAGNQRGWHQNIGYIPQMIFMMDDTVRRNVAFGIEDMDISDDKVWRALEGAQLAQFVRGLPEGLDTLVGEAGTRLSGGQRQRIGIARALYYDPEVLVFDEATSALDTETEQEVMTAINALQGSKTMLMIAHRLTTIENCDHVYRVENKGVVKER